MSITTDKVVTVFDKLQSDIIISQQMIPVIPPFDDNRTPGEVAIQEMTCKMLVPNQALELTDEQVETWLSECQYTYYLLGNILRALGHLSAGYNVAHERQSQTE